MTRDRWLITVAAVLSVGAIIGAGLVIAEVSGFSQDLRDSAVKGCQRQNEVRKAERHGLRNDISEGRAGIVEDKNIPPRFFPNIPPDEFKELIQGGVIEARRDIAKDKEVIREELQEVDCEREYPE